MITRLIDLAPGEAMIIDDTLWLCFTYGAAGGLPDRIMIRTDTNTTYHCESIAIRNEYGIKVKVDWRKLR